MQDKLKEDIEYITTMPILDVVKRANEVRRKHVGNRLDICTIFNAKSGRCSEDCRFCAQSAFHRTDIKPYPLKSAGEMVEAAAQARQCGAEHFGIVCSGNKPTADDFETICAAVVRIRETVGIRVCASLGALSLDELKRLKSSGLSRYHHNIETSESYYSRIVSTHFFEARLRTIQSAAEAGLGVCSGGIIGIGETMADRLEMALLLKELPVASVPLNILVPIKGTPLEDQPPLSCSEIIRTIALFRAVLKDRTIKIAAGRETVLKDFQALGFMAGATGMLIGGYLTVKGRQIEEDQRLIKEIESIWGSC